MSTDFEWRTGDESNWAQGPSKNDSWEPSPNRQLWPIIIGILIFLTLAVMITGFLLLNQRASGEEDAATEAVVGALDLVVAAGLDGDIDLFEALLPDGPTSFYDLQMNIFKHRLFLDRKSLGLLATPGVSETGVISADVSISADLEFAEVTFVQPYIAQLIGGITETVQLEQTQIFQRSGDSWTLAPVPDESTFWGNWTTVKRDNLSLVYPSRDEKFALQMSRDLDLLVGEICNSQTMTCPEQGKLRIRFDRDPTALLRLREPYQGLGAALPSMEYQITLPAPTLVGRPTDDAGYQALYRGYANVVASLLISQFSDQAPARSEAYIAVELEKHDLFPPPVPFQPFPRSAQIVQPPPILFPEQDIILVCNVSGSPRLLRYDLVSNSWSEALSGDDPFFPEQSGIVNGTYDALAISDDDALLLQRYSTYDSDPYFRAYLLQDGIVHPLFDEEVPYHLLSSPFQTLIDRRGRFLATFQAQDEAVSPVSIGGWIEVDHCLNDQCNLQEAQGYRFWSPDGEKTLILEIDTEGQPAIELGNAEGMPLSLLGYGISPFWLNDDTYAYTRIVPDLTGDELGEIYPNEIIIGDVGDSNSGQDEQEVALTIESLRRNLPDLPNDAGIFDVTAHPLRPDIWYVMTMTSTGDDPGGVRVLAYDRSTGMVSSLYVLDSGYLGQPMVISNNGRYLYIYGVKPQIGEYAVELVVVDLSSDLDDPEITVYPGATINYDWSLDEEWLVLLENEALRIVAPGYGYERVVSYEIPGCSAAVWLNQAND